MEKRRLTKHEIAARMAAEIQEGDVINLGFGIPLLASGYVDPTLHVTFHAECGIMGYGKVLSKEEADQIDYYEALACANPGTQFLEELPGTCWCDSAEAFDYVRNGKVTVTMLGAMEVDAEANLANWTTKTSVKDLKVSDYGIGGGMDMPVGPGRVLIGMAHTTRDNQPKIVNHTKMLLTAAHAVTAIFTDIAVIRFTEKGLMLCEVAPGWTAQEVQALTEPQLIVSPDLKEIEIHVPVSTEDVVM